MISTLYKIVFTSDKQAEFWHAPVDIAGKFKAKGSVHPTNQDIALEEALQNHPFIYVSEVRTAFHPRTIFLDSRTAVGLDGKGYFFERATSRIAPHGRVEARLGGLIYTVEGTLDIYRTALSEQAPNKKPIRLVLSPNRSGESSYKAFRRSRLQRQRTQRSGPT